MRMAGSDVEFAAAVLEPHFYAVRDVFLEFEPAPGKHLSRLKRTRMVVDPEVHDSPRHFAMCRDDGLQVKLAPEASDLPVEELTAILVHEFGHAVDFAYPAEWVAFRDKPAVWIGDRTDKPARRWRGLWTERTDDQIEWAADSIAQVITGLQVQYCGPCMVQCFSGGKLRGEGLR
jgi:hypothetical protein